MQDMRCLELSPDSTRDEDRRDPVRWAVQVALLVVVSPALFAVLAVGGACLVVQKVAAMADRVFLADRPALRLKPMRGPAGPS